MLFKSWIVKKVLVNVPAFAVMIIVIFCFLLPSQQSCGLFFLLQIISGD
jgi:hypothetical protein